MLKTSSQSHYQHLQRRLIEIVSYLQPNHHQQIMFHERDQRASRNSIAAHFRQDAADHYVLHTLLFFHYRSEICAEHLHGDYHYIINVNIECLQRLIYNLPVVRTSIMAL